MAEQTKICTKCGIEKTLNEFYPHAGCRFARGSACKSCESKRTKKWVKENPEKQQKRTRKWYKQNFEKEQKRSQRWYQANLSRKRKTTQQWRKNNPEKCKIALRKSQAKRRSTLKGKLNSNIGCAISRSLKGNKNNRHWEDIVGYTLKQLKIHIEKLFTKGMTWLNYGKWHIDHKTPISAFNFTKPEHRDFLRCWALDNLQPLWAHGNLTKQDKLDQHFQPSLLI